MAHMDKAEHKSTVNNMVKRSCPVSAPPTQMAYPTQMPTKNGNEVAHIKIPNKRNDDRMQNIYIPFILLTFGILVGGIIGLALLVRWSCFNRFGNAIFSAIMIISIRYIAVAIAGVAA